MTEPCDHVISDSSLSVSPCREPLPGAVRCSAATYFGFVRRLQEVIQNIRTTIIDLHGGSSSSIGLGVRTSAQDVDAALVDHTERGLRSAAHPRLPLWIVAESAVGEVAQPVLDWLKTTLNLADGVQWKAVDRPGFR